MLFLKKICGCILPKGKEQEVEQIITLPEIVLAPIEKNQKIGEIAYVINGETIGITSLLAKTEIKKLNLFSITENVFLSWLQLLR